MKQFLSLRQKGEIFLQLFFKYYICFITTRKYFNGFKYMGQDDSFYVVGIGASAGGLDAVQQLFNSIPNNTGIAFIIIQHLSPDFKSLMPELLAKYTSMKIYTAEEGQIIHPNCIYLNQRNKNIGINNNRFVLLDKAPKDHLNLPIDILFHMLGESYKDKAIGVILSGTGSDGSRGIKTIKEAGGIILVQDPETAQFNGMPISAISTNLSDFILSPSKIAEKIIKFTGTRLSLENQNVLISENEKAFQLILGEIQKFSGVNFKRYKINTLLRRIEKRMSLHNFEILEEYYEFIKKTNSEKEAIAQEFLIGVTSFFRDKEAFDVIKNNVIPTICENKDKQECIRVWVPGCSSGEEVYSLAMLLDDYIRANKLRIDFKIFATDIDKKALNKASNGSFAVNNIEEIDKKYFEQYFLKTGDKIQIVKRIREKIVFSYHDVTNDPPFIKVDLISCRNLLIYFVNSTQKMVLSGFQFALNKDGFLFLGNSESLGNIKNLFRTIDNKQKIYQNLHDNKRLNEQNFIGGNSIVSNYSNITQAGVYPTQSSISKKQNELFFYKYLAKKHAPVTVFIDREFSVQFIQGNFKKWYSQSEGVYTNNLLQMVSPELSIIIRNGIRRLSEKTTSVSFKNIVFAADNEQIASDLFFEKVEGIDSNEMYLVQFGISEVDNSSDQVILSSDDVSNISKQRIEDLEFELKQNKNELQNVVEELETSNEELQSSNEELMSSNEELQSSNEELQSVNEELYTVNSEFQEKNKELENLNNDITNLLNSTDIGTLFLDTHLNIRKFTPSVKRIFNLEETDIGRSIASFASEFEEETRKSIIEDSKVALEKLQTFEKEIQDSKGCWFLKRISPFITEEKRIEGVVITFVDISMLKQAKSDLSDINQKLTIALEAGNMAWWEMELPSGKVLFNENKTRMLGYNSKDFTHYNDFMKIVHPDDKKAVMKAMEEHLLGKIDSFECQYRIKTATGKYKWFHDVGKVIMQTEEKKIVSGIVLEITSKKETELQLLEAIKKTETANIYKNQFLANMSHEIRSPMNGLVGFANLLRDEDIDNKTRNRYIDIIESTSNQLLNLINDIIDVSKIEAGELKISIESCNVNSLIQELEATFNELKHQRKKDHISIVGKLNYIESQITIKTDPARLKQVLTNLLSNALKFTDEGTIEFGYTIEKNKMIFTVSDSGIGMSKEELNIIFERFQRIEHNDKVKYDGTGLGLSISKGIINLLGGSIAVRSEKGKGSVFTFDIPFIPSDAKIEATVTNSVDYNVFKSRKILIADDDNLNRNYLKTLLKDLPLQVTWAENGEEAIELFKQNEDLSLILMDIRMPVLDGFKAAKEILDYKPNANIIAQTAYAMSSDREKCLKNGFVDYISKPIQKEDLMEIIAKWIV